jgi:hypothetical protein
MHRAVTSSSGGRLTFARAIATRGAIDLRSSVLGAAGTLLRIENERTGPS